MWKCLQISFLLYFVVIVSAWQRSRTPKIVKQVSQEVFFVAGQSVRLPCVAEGSAPLTYTWTRNNYQFLPSGNDDRVIQIDNEGTIVFVRPEDKDEGIYQCFASNSYGVSVSQQVKFRMAKLRDFEFSPDRTRYPSLGSGLTLNCIPPESMPFLDVFWVVKNPGGRFEPVSLEGRVTMDYEYRLRFTHVTKDDEMGGKPYACLALNSMLRKSVVGEANFIRPQGHVEELRPAQYLWASPDDTFGFRGTDFTVKCIFSGNPTPNVTWERVNGTDLPNNTQVQSFGQELMFRNLRFEDAGRYRCLASNPYTVAHVERQIEIRVESLPYWLTEPEDVEVAQGGSAQFHCHAEAVPPPTYFWYVNGVPLEDVRDPRLTPDRFQRPSVDRIVFLGLNLMDSMVLQCNVSNKHGYIWADFSLDVVVLKENHVAQRNAGNPILTAGGKPTP